MSNMYDNITGRAPIATDDLGYIGTGNKASDILSGGGGTTDYNDLNNKPTINNVELKGNKSASDLGLQPTIDSTHKLSSDMVDDTGHTNKFATAAQLAQIETNQNNISISDITSSFTAATGFTKSTLSKVYKQGKHVFGTLIIKIDSGTIATAETTIATIASTNRPAIGYTTFCGFGTSEYNIRSIGSAYFGGGSGDIIATDYATTNSVCNINIDYCTA